MVGRDDGDGGVIVGSDEVEIDAAMDEIDGERDTGVTGDGDTRRNNAVRSAERQGGIYISCLTICIRSICDTGSEVFLGVQKLLIHSIERESNCACICAELMVSGNCDTL